MLQIIEQSQLLAVKTIQTLREFIGKQDTMETYRTDPKAFTRRRTLDFPTMVYLLLSNMTKTLAVELENLLSSQKIDTITASAFTQRRYLISHKLFSDLNNLLVGLFYSDQNPVIHTWSGFKLKAIDGSICTLPETPELRNKFGTQRGGSKKNPTYTCQTRLMLMHDVLNKMVIKSELHPLSKAEVSVAYDWVEQLSDDSLYLFDRGFGSFLLFWLMQKYQKHFVVRLKLGFNKVVSDFVASGKTDEIVQFTTHTKLSHGNEIVPKDTTITVRLVRVILENGDIEVLATSLLDQTAYPTEVFGELYNSRWGIETCLDTLKNKFLMLCFSGIKPAAIYQEVYALMLLYNVHQLLLKPAQAIVDDKVARKKKAMEDKQKQLSSNDQQVQNTDQEPQNTDEKPQGIDQEIQNIDVPVASNDQELPANNDQQAQNTAQEVANNTTEVSTKTAKTKPRKKKLTYKRKVNENVTIGIIQGNLFSLWLLPEFEHIIDRLIKTFAKHTQSVRPGRSNKRKKKPYRAVNNYTLVNYKRVA